MTVSTALEVVAAGRVALKQPGATLLTVAQALVADRPAETRPDTVDFPPLPAVVEINDKVRAALVLLPDVFGAVQPHVRRTLTPKEIGALYRERNVLRDIGKVLDQRDESIKEYIRNHIDVDAEERGQAIAHAAVDHATGQIIADATQRDTHGHYVLAGPQRPVRVSIPGANEQWSSEYRSAKDTVEIDGDLLLQMYEDGDIDRSAYLAFTREVRVLDNDKALKAVNDNPDLLDVLVKITRKVAGTPGTALQVRPVK